jgi:peptide subunit release factor 1 (eRF1)
VTDLAEWAAEQAFDTDATIATVRAGAARVLTARGGVGALLRY